MSNCQDKHQTTDTKFCPDCGEKIIKVIEIRDEPKKLTEEERVANRLTEIAKETVKYIHEENGNNYCAYSKKYLCKFFELVLERGINIPKDSVFMMQYSLDKVIPITQLYNICPNLRRLQLNELFLEDDAMTSWLYQYDIRHMDKFQKMNKDIELYDEQSIPRDISLQARAKLYKAYVDIYNTELEEKNVKRQKVC